jgi:hypothetical protein
MASELLGGLVLIGVGMAIAGGILLAPPLAWPHD